MSEVGRELGWDESITEDGKDFEPIPEGDYDFKIEKFERGRSKGEGKLPPCAMAIVTFLIRDRDNEVSVSENFVLHSSLEWKLSELFSGVGFKKKGETVRMNWNQLPGTTGRCKVGIKPGYKDPTKKYNFIEKIYPKESTYQAGRF